MPELRTARENARLEIGSQRGRNSHQIGVLGIYGLQGLSCGRTEAESALKWVLLRIWPLNPTANGRNFDADLAKTVPAAGTAKQGFSVVRRKTAAYRAIKRYN